MEKIDTKKLFQITEAAHACGLSRSTLMRLEKKGLLKPAYIAPDSGRRYYDNHNVARILQIEKFKAMGFGTEEIAGYFVRGGEAEGLLAVLEERLHSLQRRGNAAEGHGERPVLRADGDTARRDLLHTVACGSHIRGAVRRHVRFLQPVHPGGLRAVRRAAVYHVGPA